jgi:hypothetical protein
MRKPTIYEVLREKLGREPTNAELNADVKRILAEGAEERMVTAASRGKLPHQKSRRKAKKSSLDKSFDRAMTAAHNLSFAGYEFTSGPGRTVIHRGKIDLRKGDHGADPLGDGTFRMVPSGDIVDFAERNRRLAR